MKRLILILAFTAACASLTPLQRAQQSHDFLALAGDSEASLCWAVSSVTEAIATPAIAANPGHCTSPQAAGIGLTDQRHQQFNAAMKRALDAHMAIVRLLAQGSAADYTALSQAIADLLALSAQFSPGNATVQGLILHLQQARLQ